MTEKTFNGLQRISYDVDERGMGAGFVVGVTDLCVLQTFQTEEPTQPFVQWLMEAIYLWVTQSSFVLYVCTIFLCYHGVVLSSAQDHYLYLYWGVARIQYLYVAANILGFKAM
jgi:hypothetical protein